MKDDFERARDYFELGLAALKMGNFSLAELEFRSALQLSPDRVSIITNLTATLIKQDKWADAQTLCKYLISIDPNNEEGLINLGVCLLHQNNPAEAIHFLDTALELNPNSLAALINKGNALLEMQDPLSTQSYFEKALDIDPKSEEALIGMGNLHNDRREYSLGLNYFSSALSINPNNSRAKWNTSLSLLRLGEYRRGWELYESRWEIPGIKEHARSIQLPLWTSQTPLHSKTIYITCEQGFGDAIQMCRYLPLLEIQYGANVIFETTKPLLDLMKSISKTLTVVETGRLEDGQIQSIADVYCPIMSLPLAFQTSIDSIPNTIPYLYTDAHKDTYWQKKLSSIGLQGKHFRIKPYKVGLTWSGSGHYAGKKNPKRDVPFHLVLSLIESLKDQPIEFHAIQENIKDAWLNYKNLPSNLFFYPGELKTFSDTASLVIQLDLVVSIDTAVAHLSGALGQKTILALPEPSDFMTLITHEHSPWYPKTRLVRQKTIGKWPLEDIKNSILLALNE